MPAHVNAPETKPLVFQPGSASSELARRLRGAVAGEVLFDRASRGRYATDASIYQVEPVGILVPRSDADVRAAFDVCRELSVPLLPRGAGSSQCGQTVGAALVVDHSKYLQKVIAFDRDARTVTVEPGIVLDALNAWLKPHGLWFPVDVSTSAQATLGGMAGNNSCGSRSIAYGNMVHNVHAIDVLLADGTTASLGPEPKWQRRRRPFGRSRSGLRAIGLRERDEIAARVPTVMRRVGGYNIDVFHPVSERPYTTDGSVNFAHLLIGSEGTLAWTRELTLKLAPLPAHRTLGVVNFSSLHRAMECARHIVGLGPSAVELVDRTMIDLARSNPAFRSIIDAALVGEPQAILLVEFMGETGEWPLRRVADLAVLMGDLGLPGSVVRLVDAAAQRALWDVRKAGLNIMMSMRGDGKPVSFIEDCAVPLAHLADYVDRLTEVFRRHGTRGTWYAHASVGTLHVRPILDMRRDGATKMRAIAEEASALVREYKGAYSGEHGDGLVRSEWVAWQFGPRLTRAFEEIKELFDPRGLMNPGKIVRPSRMDDRALFRFPPGHRTLPVATALDWSAWNVDYDPAADVLSAPGTGSDRGPRFRQGRGDVQQQRPLPQVRRRHDVPQLSRHPRRDSPHARTSEHLAPGAFGGARSRFRVAGRARRARPLRELQGLPPRLPDGRRHGEDEDRVQSSMAACARARAEGSRDRVPAAVGALGGAVAVACEPARRDSRRCPSCGKVDRAHRAAPAPALAARHLPARLPPER